MKEIYRVLGSDPVVWVVGALVLTQSAAWFMALFHPNADRRSEAKALLRGHPLHRRTPRRSEPDNEADGSKKPDDDDENRQDNG